VYRVGDNFVGLVAG